MIVAAQCLACGAVIVCERIHESRMCSCPNRAFVDVSIGGLTRVGARDWALIRELSEGEAQALQGPLHQA